MKFSQIRRAPGLRIHVRYLVPCLAWVFGLAVVPACRKSAPPVTATAPARHDQPSKLFPISADSIVQLTWRSGGRQESWQRIDGHWYYGGMEAVGEEVMTLYLQDLTAIGGFPRPHAQPVGLSVGDELVVTPASGGSPIVLTVYPVLPGPALMIHSSALADGYFLGDSLGLYARIFTALQQIRPDGQ